MEMMTQLAQELHLRRTQVEAAVALLDQGCTVPFIARYRKEATESMDDAQLRELCDRLAYLRGLEKRREEVRASIEAQGKLTEELATAISEAGTLAEVEDLYRPYRPKRRTRAGVAREKGLEKLAAAIRAQDTLREPLEMAAEYVCAEKGVESPEDALQGALDIIAEDLSDDAGIRAALRRMIHAEGRIVSAGSVMG